MRTKMNDKMIAFIAGDLTVTLVQIFGNNIWDQLGHFGMKLGATILLGVAGGVAGMVGKDLYNRFKNRKNKKV